MGTLYFSNISVGFVFVLRDYAQREIGHKVLLATALAGIPVWYLLKLRVALRKWRNTLDFDFHAVL